MKFVFPSGPSFIPCLPLDRYPFIWGPLETSSKQPVTLTRRDLSPGGLVGVLSVALDKKKNGLHDTGNLLSYSRGGSYSKKSIPIHLRTFGDVQQTASDINTKRLVTGRVGGELSVALEKKKNGLHDTRSLLSHFTER
ncbi:hypothetical protein CDAR_59431 [Caerostris darwini]|uniref:Uncharacterized protein n=1 Tax=Caerostris darwini TaxID=1538125 RepID=A0AAV4X221_9ARAC|nr:hypothetical protein CDAR_59431 [Caerostris darwini]